MQIRLYRENRQTKEGVSCRYEEICFLCTWTFVIYGQRLASFFILIRNLSVYRAPSRLLRVGKILRSTFDFRSVTLKRYFKYFNTFAPTSQLLQNKGRFAIRKSRLRSTYIQFLGSRGVNQDSFREINRLSRLSFRYRRH